MYHFNDTGLDLVHIIQIATIVFQESRDINQILNFSALRLASPNLKRNLELTLQIFQLLATTESVILRNNHLVFIVFFARQFLILPTFLQRWFNREWTRVRTRTRVVIGLVYYAMTLPGCDDDGAECIQARVSVGGRGACHPGGLHVSGTRLDRLPFPCLQDPFKCLTARRRPPGIAGIIILYRRTARENRLF